MVTSIRVIEVFSKIVGNWHMSAVDANGKSGGLFSSWNPKKANFDAFHSVAGIILQGKLFNSDQVVKVVNCYGPYLNRLQYWNLIKAGGLLNERGLILGGDLNFTVSARETWGNTHLDLDAYFFFDMIRDVDLYDVEPTVLGPTWQNGRGGHAGIGKRLDRFLVDSKLLSRTHAFRSWVVQTKISDHFSIVFQWELEGERIHYPFKFNST